jgi:predicted amidohydrolase YtcJ
MQFIHCVSDCSWVEGRIGKKRAEGAYAWRSFLSSGSVIAAGSDMPVESFDPFLGIHAAVTRAGTDGAPEGGWYPEQRLGLEEALAAYTTGAAFASFSEKRTGSLKEGKFADFVVLSKDISGIPSEEIASVKVLATVVGSEIVYSAPDSPLDAA